MDIIQKLKNAITGGEWSIAYRPISSNIFKLVAPSNEYWYADPFVFEAGEEHYIFVEQYRKDINKGCIGYFQFEKGIPVNKGIVIENNYHMSYPDVFEYKDNYYMIPESSANNSVDLYVAERFPDKWKKIKSLIMGEKLVDTTVFQDRGRLYLITYSLFAKYEIRVYELFMEKLEVKLLSKKHYTNNIGRPGGRLYVKDGKLIRPAQDSSRKYGENLILYDVDTLDINGEFVEREIRRIGTDAINIANNPERLHQITHDSMFEVIDVYKEKIDLLHTPKIYIRSHRK